MKLTDVLYTWAGNRPPKVITRISPSMLGRCHRAHYFAIKGIPQTTPPNPGAVLNFQVGFLWEKVVSEALRGSGVPFVEQLHLLDEELNTEGTCDYVTYKPDTNEWTVADSKTESIKATEYRKRQGKSFFGSHPEYVVQLATYAILLERQGFKVPDGKFLVITKDNGLLEEVVVIFSDEIKQKVLGRIKTLNEYLTNGNLPPCTCEGWQINYCNWGDVSTIAANAKGKEVPFECCKAELL